MVSGLARGMRGKSSSERLASMLGIDVEQRGWHAGRARPASKGPRTALPSRRDRTRSRRFDTRAPVKQGGSTRWWCAGSTLARRRHGLHARDAALRERAHVAADRLLGHRLREERAVGGEDAQRDAEESVE